MDRVAALRNAFNGAYDGYLIFNPANMLYFTGVPGTTALLIPPEGEGVVYVSSTNYEQAKAQIRGFNVKLIKPAENLLHKVAVDAKQLLVHGLLVDVLGVDSWRFLTKDFSNVIVDGIPIVNLRAVKDADEILLMRKAAELTSKGMQAASEAIKLGMRECEVAGEVEYAMRKAVVAQQPLNPLLLLESAPLIPMVGVLSGKFKTATSSWLTSEQHLITTVPT
jgi:Xaa-Pro aminopeptidase